MDKAHSGNTVLLFFLFFFLKSLFASSLLSMNGTREPDIWNSLSRNALWPQSTIGPKERGKPSAEDSADLRKKEREKRHTSLSPVLSLETFKVAN